MQSPIRSAALTLHRHLQQPTAAAVCRWLSAPRHERGHVSGVDAVVLHSALQELKIFVMEGAQWYEKTNFETRKSEWYGEETREWQSGCDKRRVIIREWMIDDEEM